MPKPRNRINRELPIRWRWHNGAFRYRVPRGEEHLWDGKTQFTLGKTLSEAHRVFSERTGPFGNCFTMEQLCDRYAVEVMPGKAPATQKSNQYSLRRIRPVFGKNSIAAIEPHHIYEYRDRIGVSESKKKANLDLEVLSHMFTKAIQWGLRHDHPMTGKKVTKFSLTSTKAKRYVTDAELLAFMACLPAKWSLFCALTVWTGRRKSEILRLRVQDLTADGIRFTDAKNKGDSFMVGWTDETRRIVQAILNCREKVGSIYLFATRHGQPYIKDDGDTSGFDSIWQRRMRQALNDGVVTERFSPHDLRRKRSSEMTLPAAQALLRHTNPATTKRSYRALEDVIRAK